jgi:predicted alpha/beta hydrolase
MEARELAKTGPSRCLAGLVVGVVTVGFVAVDLLAAGAGTVLREWSRWS